MVNYIISNYEDPEDELACSNLLSNLSVRRFIEVQVDAIVYESKEYTYNPFGWQTDYIDNFRKLYNLPKPYNLTPKDINLMRVDFYKIIKIVIPLSVHLEEYSIRVEYSKYRKRKSLIFSLYLVCWGYILFVSIPSLPIDTINLILDIQDTLEPFSGLELDNDTVD
jgi:hypothetical protein